MTIGKDDNNKIVFGCDHKSCDTVLYTGADTLKSIENSGWYRFPAKGPTRLHRYEQLCPLHGKVRSFMMFRAKVSKRMVCSEIAA